MTASVHAFGLVSVAAYLVAYIGLSWYVGRGLTWLARKVIRS